MTDPLKDFRDPPQEWIPFCKACGREVPANNWTPLDELECECGIEGQYDRKLRYPPRPANSAVPVNRTRV